MTLTAATMREPSELVADQSTPLVVVAAASLVPEPEAGAEAAVDRAAEDQKSQRKEALLAKFAKLKEDSSGDGGDGGAALPARSARPPPEPAATSPRHPTSEAENQLELLVELPEAGLTLRQIIENNQVGLLLNELRITDSERMEEQEKPVWQTYPGSRHAARRLPEPEPEPQVPAAGSQHTLKAGAPAKEEAVPGGGGGQSTGDSTSTEEESEESDPEIAEEGGRHLTEREAGRVVSRRSSGGFGCCSARV